MKKKRRKKTLFEFLKFLSASREASGKMWNSFITRTVAVKFFFLFSFYIIYLHFQGNKKKPFSNHMRLLHTKSRVGGEQQQ